MPAAHLAPIVMFPESQCINENELISWVEGQLSEEEIARFDEHLDACGQCQALVAEVLRSGSADDVRVRRDETFQDGEVVAERYRVVRFLARGGMGEVYEVHDLWLNNRLALKTLLATISDNAAALSRLKAEVLIARQVSHPNVCRIFDFGFHDKRLTPGDRHVERVAFLTMELLNGETLSARLERLGRFAIDEARPIAEQMIAGISHAHAAGVVHRDFKTDNVMLVDDGGSTRVVITDFGLARSALRVSEGITSSHHGAIGTLDYMAPEQLVGRAVTRQSDIYALGVVLYEMVTGRLPFDAESPLGRALQRASTKAPRASKFVGELPSSWVTAIARCMEIDPEDRFSEAPELLPLIGSAPAGSRRSLSRTKVVALAVVAAALVGGGIFAAVQSDDGEARAESGESNPSSTHSVAAAPQAAPHANTVATTAALVPEPPVTPPAPSAPATSVATPNAATSSAPPKRNATPRRERPAASQPAPPSASAESTADGLLDPFAAQ
jgi:serine/threonine protein kinase